MAEGSVITDDMRSRIGIELPPVIYEIEKEPIRRWAEAIDDPNPLYHDEEYARKSKHGGMIAPPGFIGNYAFPNKTGGDPRVKSPFTRQLNGGSAFEFLKPVRPGDVLTATSKLADLYEREGRLGIGRMLFQVFDVIFRNQQGETVVIVHRTSISYEGNTK